jgi:hypothetical protein
LRALRRSVLLRDEWRGGGQLEGGSFEEVASESERISARRIRRPGFQETYRWSCSLRPLKASPSAIHSDRQIRRSRPNNRNRSIHPSTTRPSLLNLRKPLPNLLESLMKLGEPSAERRLLESRRELRSLSVRGTVLRVKDEYHGGY